MLIIGQNEVLK